jgi:hypothetical protein
LRNILRFLYQTIRFIRFVTRIASDLCDNLFDRVLAFARERRGLDPRVAAALGFATLALYLLPTLHAGLSTDDAHRPYLFAFGRANGLGLWKTLLADAQYSDRELGGVFPLTVLASFIWLIVPSVLFVHLVALLMIALNVFTLSAVVAKLSRSNGVALLVVPFVALAVQLRLGSDAILGPLFMYQIFLEFVLIAILAILWYLKSGAMLGRLLAAGCSAAAALSGPFGYVLIVVLAAIAIISAPFAWRRRFVVAVIACIPLLVLWTFASVRAPVTEPAGVAPQMITPVDAGRRLIAALPITYRGSGNIVGEAIKGSAADTRFDKIPYPSIVEWLAVLAIAASMFFGSMSPRGADRRSEATLLAIGTLLWLLPAFVLDVDHPDVTAGCYYLEAFGIGALGALAVASISERMHRRDSAYVVAACASLLAFFIAYGNVRANAFVIKRSQLADAPRALLSPALHAGLLQGVPRYATIFARGFHGLTAGTGDISDLRFALFAITNKLYETEDSSTSNANSGGRKFLLEGAVDRLTLGSITLVRLAPARSGQPLANQGTRYARYLSPEARSRAIDKASMMTGQGERLSTIPFDVTDLLSTTKRLCGLVPAREIFSAALPAVDWSRGFYPPYPSIPFTASDSLPTRADKPFRNTWAYAGQSGNLVITNHDCRTAPLNFTARVYTVVPARVDVTFLNYHRTYLASQSGVDVDLEIPSSPRVIDLRFTTSAPPGHDTYFSARYSDVRQYDIHMLVNDPQVYAVTQ